MTDKEKNIRNKAIDLYYALVEGENSGCELKLTEGYHMTVMISRTVEFPEFEPIKVDKEAEDDQERDD